jgi:hypothetical protein
MNSLYFKYNIKKECIGKSAFGYEINEYEIGHGKKHVLLIGATHGCELITTYFIVEFILSILQNQSILKKFTFHCIPILNPEGYIISSSNVISNCHGLNEYELEFISSKYMNIYNYCDELARKGIKIKNGFYCVLNSSVKNINNFYMEESVINILKSCNLSENILPVWSANGLGIDQNSNSIHEFNRMKELRKYQKCAALRYNIIPVTKPSPMSYPGEFVFDRSIENLSLYKYIQKIYKDFKLEYIFSYHSTGGEIYGYPETDDNEKILEYMEAMYKYSKISEYKIINEKLKYGVMDYYRKNLNNTICLTIELSKFNGNPIGPYSNLLEFKEDIIKNKNALINTIC